ncbi:MAG: polysaccharide biosynthesis/export family protein [Geobacteraceae bacterium]|nr:polysaccharide biosynthesis/export family protein [Geobacteraceae bacterium]
MTRIIHNSSAFLLAGILSLAVAGCAKFNDLPHGTIKEVGSGVISSNSSAVTERESVVLAQEKPEAPPSLDYVIGIGDVVQVSVAGKPEFNALSTTASSKVNGSRVDGNGAIHLPFLGAVKVAGLTITQARERLQEGLQKYFKEPWVLVEVAEYHSQPLYLLGQFRSSGTYYLDRPLTLVQGLSLGSGFDATANLRGARISRGGRIMRIDLADLLLSGDARQNIWLQGGDTIYIPDNRTQQVFVFGAVKKSGPVPVPNTGLNLAQVIAAADFRDAGFDMNHLRIIRSISPTRGELLVVDYEKILRGEAVPLQLQDGDIVYVPKNSFGGWNDAIAEILPSLQAVSAILQPFVTIKYLNQ